MSKNKKYVTQKTEELLRKKTFIQLKLRYYLYVRRELNVSNYFAKTYSYCKQRSSVHRVAYELSI